MSGSDWLQSRIDTTVAHPARRYDYWLGGKDNFAADRESGDAIAAKFPAIRTAVLENRRFLRRAVTHLAGEAGIRQFLDVGTGLPTASNTHEVAQSVAPESRIVYVDNDPLVLVHARALLTSAPEGATAYVDADVRDPGRILDDPDLRRTLDLSQPVALMLLAILHFVPEDDDPYAIVRRLLDALPKGSYLVASHATSDYLPPELVADISSGRHGQGRLRTRAEVERFFDGLDLVSPGVVPLPEWRAEGEPQPRPAAGEVAMYAGVARLA
ncbi:SAM-dependent methyltransferase [Dactylosporangium sp. NPDC005572]|uniref:SAM-dependent methyltransferase n=1 Tax=Dactylosporangium sp. NPDC005572 TaxID=3156889 RepID=UPI0033BB5246